jgi:hypothetical protein
MANPIANLLKSGKTAASRKFGRSARKGRRRKR